MPKDTSIKKILLIGSGPIVIGQGCEFDYSGVQACKALAEEGYDVVLVNSNPATIMTDPEFAQRTYIEPITPEAIEKILEREKPDAVLPTLGGQTALNAAMSLVENGALERHGARLIGANAEAIKPFPLTAEQAATYEEILSEMKQAQQLNMRKNAAIEAGIQAAKSQDSRPNLRIFAAVTFPTPCSFFTGRAATNS